MNNDYDNNGNDYGDDGGPNITDSQIKTTQHVKDAYVKHNSPGYQFKDTTTASHRTLLRGRSADIANKKAAEIAAIAKQVKQFASDYPDDTEQQNQNNQQLQGAFLESPVDGLATIVQQVMVKTGFHPWKTMEDQTADEASAAKTAHDQVEGFDKFITALNEYGVDQTAPDGVNTEQYFTFIESDVKVVEQTKTDFSDLIGAVLGVLDTVGDLATNIGTAAATEGAGGDMNKIPSQAKDVVKSIAGIVDVATRKETFDQSNSLCHMGIIHYDNEKVDEQGEPVPDYHQLTWSSYFTFVQLVKSKEKCGKTFSSEVLVVAYAKFGFKSSTWQGIMKEKMARAMDIPVSTVHDLTNLNTRYSHDDTQQSSDNNAEQFAKEQLAELDM
jgi:hypothetical protein